MPLLRMRVHCLPYPIHKEHQRIFDLLTLVATKFDPPIILRIAGGWVRNSLLDIPCNDFDVAIETKSVDQMKTVTGETFANALMRHQKEIGEETRSIGVIKRNPQQSKHIEAASTHIFGISVDFLHLRKDEYTAEDHRIPVIMGGSIEEDAFRRDFTVNALYYNLHTRKVEDYVGGIPDLNDRILRCPLDPHETFLDDPLRLLRAVRFAAQFDLTIDDAIIRSARSPEIQYGLLNKVSRERVSKEITTSVERNAPLRTLRLLKTLSCRESVFRYAASDHQVSPKNFASATAPFHWEANEWRFIEELLDGYAGSSLITTPSACFFFALFMDRVNRGEKANTVESSLTDGLKLPNKTTSAVLRMLEASKAFVALLSSLFDHMDFEKWSEAGKMFVEIIHPKEKPLDAKLWLVSPQLSSRIRLFTIFRELKEVDYRPALFAAVLWCFHQRTHEFRGILPESIYRAIDTALLSDPSNLVECRNWHPIIRGNEIVKHIAMDKGAIKTALVKVLYLRVEKPAISVEEAIEVIQQNASCFASHEGN